MELGPYRVQEGGKLTYNNGSWDEFANLLFVDNPVGTGFSYVDSDSYLHELQEMADHFIIFLEKWFKIFPEFETDDIYIAGESYAGQHIPYIAKAISDRNAKVSGPGTTQWNIKGLIIGNGWIAPLEQYQAYLPFAYSEGMIQGGTNEAEQVEKAQAGCLEALNKPGAADEINIGACENVLNTLLEVTTTKDGQCYNMYDIRLRDDSPFCGMNWPPDLKTVTPYLRRKDVTEALHINPEKRTGWTECDGSVSSNFRATKSIASVKLLPGLLESGIPILLFSGAKDLICAHRGTEDLISNLQWNGGKGFETSPGVWAPKRDWTFEGEAAGIYQEARNLTYVLFYNSSHMVPFDYPRRSRDMLDRFMGVDIASIGGTPTDSRIDGEKSHSETSVGGHPNSTAAIEDQKQKLHDAELKAYYRSGEAALVVVIIISAIFGWWVWRSRRGNKVDLQGLGQYMSLPRVQDGDRMPASKERDVEAGDFDENELENIPMGRGARGTDTRDLGTVGHEHYDLASDSDDSDEDETTRTKSKA